MRYFQFLGLILSIIPCNAKAEILSEDNCRRACCPNPYTISINDDCLCDKNKTVSDKENTCVCTNGELAYCRSSCISQREAPGVVNTYGGGCLVHKGNPTCSCYRTDEVSVGSPADPPPAPCNSYQCQVRCCPKWGACDPQTGGCYCMGGTEDLQEVQRQCAPGGKPCTEAEIEFCQQSCTGSPEKSSNVFAFAECTRGSDGSMQCNCQPYQG